MRRYHSLAAHALVVSGEIEALDGLDGEDRRVLALHALVADAPSAWLQDRPSHSQRAAERTGRLAGAIDKAVREAAGLDPVLDAEPAELLRFVVRMAAAAESRDLMGRRCRGRRRRRLPAVEAPHQGASPRARGRALARGGSARSRGPTRGGREVPAAMAGGSED